MKILYAIQGTGNGHLSRARDIIPILQQKGDLDILVSGIQADVALPYPVKYTFKGLSFIFGKKGGIDLVATYKKSNLKQLFKEIKSLPVEDYDLIINDFGSSTITLPAPATCPGRELLIFARAGGSYAITLTPTPVGIVQVVYSGECHRFISTGSEWVTAAGY